MPYPDLVLPRAAVRELDRRAIEDFRVPSLLLMENAGRACADAGLARFGPGRTGSPIVVLAGPGNNGGDGLVIARTLWNRGHEARVVFVGPRAKLEEGGPDVRANLDAWRRLGRDVDVVEDADGAAALGARLAASAWSVDALFGTGLARELADPWAAAIGALNAGARPVLAVDVPSGLDADTGEALGACVRARLTVTFVARKPGLLRGLGPEVAGEVVVAEIGIPRPLLEAAGRSAPG